jgi:glyoxylase-like metal-dependent hydrolase (beta-lactamase superfamily II)
MRVAPNIYLVASGVQGCSLTDDLDCNCWLFDAGEGLVLFDTGAGLDIDAIFNVMREDGLAPEKLSHVILTHAHGDHSGGAFEIKRRSGCQLLCGELTAELLGRGEDAISLAAARTAGVYPADYIYNPGVPDGVLQSQVPMTIGSLKITPIETRGHSVDHTSFLVEQAAFTALVTGDAMLHSGRIIYQGTYDFDVLQSGISIRKLATFDFEVLLPGHGFFVRHGGRRHVEAAVEHLNQLKTPRPVEFLPI